MYAEHDVSLDTLIAAMVADFNEVYKNPIEAANLHTSASM